MKTVPSGLVALNGGRDVFVKVLGVKLYVTSFVSYDLESGFAVED